MNKQIRLKLSKRIEFFIFIHGWCKYELDIEKGTFYNFYAVRIGCFTFDLHISRDKKL